MSEDIKFPDILKDTKKTLQDMEEGKKFIKKIVQSGKCPNCGEPIEDYGTQELLDFTAYYPFTCKCGFTGREWYNLEFTGFTDGAGNEIGKVEEKEVWDIDRY